MKRIVIILGLLFGLMLSGGIFSIKATAAPVPTQFEGDWVGIIKIQGRKMNIRLTITGNEVQQFYKDKDFSWQPLNLAQFQFNSQKENAIFFWIRTGSIRTETNIFALTLKDERTIEVGFTRQINRLRSFGGNETQKFEGIGKLWRIG